MVGRCRPNRAKVLNGKSGKGKSERVKKQKSNSLPFHFFTFSLFDIQAFALPAVVSRELTVSQSIFEKNASMYFGLSAGA